jgi:hypothetical protein
MRELLKDYEKISQEETCSPEEHGMTVKILKEKKKTINKITTSGKIFFQKWKRVFHASVSCL